MPRQSVVAPPSAARPINLLTTARAVDDGLDWSGGVSFIPEQCNPGGSMDPCTGPETTKTAGTANDIVEWDPYLLYTYESCPYALNEDTYNDLVARARRTMAAQTSHLLEQILWSNEVDGIDFGATHPNVGLVEVVAPNIGVPAPPVTALEQMDDLLIAALGGRVGMVHVPMPLFHHLAFYGLIKQEGNVWRTVTGNLVVPGTGYSGTDPTNTEDSGIYWIYGTSTVEYRLGTIDVPGGLQGAIDRATNQLVVRAERPALAYWDRCAHVGVPVCLTDPGPACGTES